VLSAHITCVRKMLLEQNFFRLEEETEECARGWQVITSQCRPFMSSNRCLPANVDNTRRISTLSTPVHNHLEIVRTS
jgi:hypothetical protein